MLEGDNMGGRGADIGGDGALVPKYGQLRNTKVPPKGVGFCAVCVPQSG